MKILCVGQLVADVLVQGVDTVDFTVDTRRVDNLVVQNGGDCLNTAINLKKLGNDVSFSGLVGNDIFGTYLRDVIQSHGIETRDLHITDKTGTGSVVVLINSKGERIFLYYGGTNDLFSFSDINLEIIKEVQIVHVGGTFVLPRFDGKGAAKLFALAQKNGKITTMDNTWDTTGNWLKTIEPCLPYLDFYMPSDNEAEKITGENRPDLMAQFLINKGIKNVIIKLGKKGCYVHAFGEKFYRPAYDVPVVDTTGAGDSFVAGILTGLVRGWNIHKAVDFASAVSAFCIQKLGATTGIPSSETVLEFINNTQGSII
ncbi:MAG: carbohydrate kinase family protein [Treponema sp.]|jgi:sugar/nucleoside kinase (ribokinase family)|nr:carbohydrate kinase family protein [Treponema sp.]